MSTPGLSAGGTRGDRWSPWGKNEKNKGGPGGTSLPLRVLRLPIWTFPDFLHFFVPSCPRTFKYGHKVLLLSKIRQQREATANPVFASVAGKRPASETFEVVYKKKEKTCQSHSIMRVRRRRRSKMLRTVASPGTFGCMTAASFIDVLRLLIRSLHD